MPEHLPDRRQIGAACEHLARERVPQPMRAHPPEPRPACDPHDRLADRADAHRPRRRLRSHEHRATLRHPWPPIAHIRGDRLTHLSRQRQPQLATLAADRDLSGSPVDVVKSQAGCLRASDAQPREQHDERVIAATGSRAPVARVQDPLQLLTANPFGQTRQPAAPHRRNRGRQRHLHRTIEVDEPQQLRHSDHGQLRGRATLARAHLNHEPPDERDIQALQLDPILDRESLDQRPDVRHIGLDARRREMSLALKPAREPRKQHVDRRRRHRLLAPQPRRSQKRQQRLDAPDARVMVIASRATRRAELLHHHRREILNTEAAARHPAVQVPESPQIWLSSRWRVPLPLQLGGEPRLQTVQRATRRRSRYRPVLRSRHAKGIGTRTSVIQSSATATAHFASTSQPKFR